MSQIKLHLDVVEGTLDLECSGEDFEGIMTRIEGMMRNLTNVPRRKMADVHVAPEDAEQEITEEEDAPVTNGKAVKKPRRRKGSGHANWKVIDNLMTEAQRGALRKFYAEKAPGKQNDQVAVLAHKLSEMLDREGFDGNEIHTAFQAVNEKTPANLTGVFGNMTGEGLGKVIDKKWTPNFKSSDMVKHDLPAAKPTKK
ncbi:hypothetical protein [Qipengyuania flava]|uniref:hypothetical protein n=1 Tax=Qipengyuania flava TaxID=192812 RepID=UPI00321B42D2